MRSHKDTESIIDELRACVSIFGLQSVRTSSASLSACLKRIEEEDDDEEDGSENEILGKRRTFERDTNIYRSILSLYLSLSLCLSENDIWGLRACVFMIGLYE